MVNILENQMLEVENLVSYKGKVTRIQLDQIGKDMDKCINEVGAKRIGYPITATYGVEGNVMDMEILIPIDRKIEINEKYIYKDRLRISNALVARHTGNPVMLQDSCNELNEYIVKNKYEPITVGYHITVNIDTVDLDNSVIDVYVGLNPNIL